MNAGELRGGGDNCLTSQEDPHRHPDPPPKHVLRDRLQALEAPVDDQQSVVVATLRSASSDHPSDALSVDDEFATTSKRSGG